MKCPTCKETTLVMSERQSIEIDYCPECREVWLDHGELDKIIERTNNEFKRTASDYKYSDRNYKNSKYESRSIDGYNINNRPHKKKKSFFSELFDF